MSDLTPKQAFLQSVDRCAASPDFIPAFYERFMASSESVREKFRNADFEAQHAMLLRSLRLVAGATAGDPEALQELDARAVTHDRYHLDIHLSLYSYWLVALIQTAAEFDPEWSLELDKIWERMLGFAARYMARRY